MARGKEVFFLKKAGCYACHRAAGKGGNVGPDLSQVGRFRTTRDLLESIVFPSSSNALRQRLQMNSQPHPHHGQSICPGDEMRASAFAHLQWLTKSSFALRKSMYFATADPPLAERPALLRTAPRDLKSEEPT